MTTDRKTSRVGKQDRSRSAGVVILIIAEWTAMHNAGIQAGGYTANAASTIYASG